MLAIRLARTGRKKKPMYRVVVSEKTKDMYGDHLEILGNYNPHTKEIILKTERIEHWLKSGAQASNTVHNLLIKEGVLKDAKKAKAVAISKKRKARKEKGKENNKSEVKKEEKPAEDKKVDAEVPSEDKKLAEEKKETPASEEKKVE